jgi:hypothetical protein
MDPISPLVECFLVQISKSAEVITSITMQSRVLHREVIRLDDVLPPDSIRIERVIPIPPCLARGDPHQLEEAENVRVLDRQPRKAFNASFSSNFASKLIVVFTLCALMGSAYGLLIFIQSQSKC